MSQEEELSTFEATEDTEDVENPFMHGGVESVIGEKGTPYRRSKMAFIAYLISTFIFITVPFSMEVWDHESMLIGYMTMGSLEMSNIMLMLMLFVMKDFDTPARERIYYGIVYLFSTIPLSYCIFLSVAIDYLDFSVAALIFTFLSGICLMVSQLLFLIIFPRKQ
jgi:F0F1-type ATP synthase assembly protein I